MEKKRKYPKRGSTLQWMRDHLDYTGDECLTWPFFIDHKGYGRIRVNKVHHTAARVLCEMVNGPPPTPKHEAAHTCGRGHEGCVTPNHLVWATKRENENHKQLHGRVRSGERNPLAKLTADKVREIRRGCTGRLGEKKEFAQRFGIKQSTVTNLLTRKTWRHVA